VKYQQRFSVLQRAQEILDYYFYIFTAKTGHLTRRGVAFLETKIDTQSMTLSRARAHQVPRLVHKRSSEKNHWFTREERAQVYVLATLIVPSDEMSPGAEHLDVLGPSVVDRLDALVAGSPHRQVLYARGLLATDQLARDKWGGKLVDLSSDYQLNLLGFIDHLNQKWSKPTSLMRKITRKLVTLYYRWSGLFAAVELFPRLVQDVFQVFYTDQVSWIWLGYDGPPMPNGYPDLLNRRVRGPSPEAGDKPTSTLLHSNTDAFRKNLLV